MKQNEIVVWRRGDSQESFQALVKQYRAFADSAKPGDKAVLPVAVCRTQRIMCDGFDRIIMMPCKACIRSGETYVSVAVCPPRFPGGLHPGVWVGVPLIAANDMQPMPKRRSYRQSFNHY